MQTNMKKTTTKMFLLVLSASFLAVMASAQPATFNFNTLEGLNVLSYTGTIGASSPYVGGAGSLYWVGQLRQHGKSATLADTRCPVHRWLAAPVCMT